MSHTPGPWSCDEYGNIAGPPIEGGATMKPATFTVAQVRGWGHLQYRKDGAEMQDANGRLIAAAPELLAALKECHLELDTRQGRDHRNHDLISSITALITKAQGPTV
jgi:hypothetical protein